MGVLRKDLSMSYRRCVITGGFGFQGSHLALALLARGDRVTVLSTPSARNQARLRDLYLQMAQRNIPLSHLTAVSGSVSDAEILEKTLPGHSGIIHMAAWTSVDASLDRPWPPFEINAQGTLAVLEACRRFGDQDLRLIVASSCEVYGPAWVQESLGGGPTPQDEDWPMLPRSPYAASKIAADRMAYAYAVTYGMDITILRPSNIYGPGQYAGALGAVIPRFTRAALTGEPMVVTGGGQQFREFLYVEDLVSAYLTALDGPRDESGSGATYNVGSGEIRSILDLAEDIRAGVNPRTPITHSDARVADVSGFLLDSSKFQTRFGWKSTVDIAGGLVKYLTWAKARHAKGEAI